MGPLVVSASGAHPPWAERLDASRASAADALPQDLTVFNSVWIDAPELQPLGLARQVAARDETLQTVVVAPQEDMSIHERALLFTPGLGEVWLMEPDDVGPETLERASEVTATRRRYRASRGQMNTHLQQLDPRPRRAVVSDAYLAALLRVLPDPVISIDESARIVSWSGAAERCLGVPDSKALGRSIFDVVRAEDPAALRAALERGLQQSARLEISLDGVSERLIMEAVIAPVSTGGVHVRMLVLRDVTRERESMARLAREVERRSRSYAAMSHEIRTPINAIMGYNELLRMDAVDGDKRDEYLGRSQKAAAHLLELVNDVLDLSKLESGVLEIQHQPVRVEEIIQDLLSTLEPMARERGTTLEVECRPDAGQLLTDAKRLKQILINLVSNAVKFGESQPVRVRCEREDSCIVFEVEDQGRGIDPAELDRIFEEFIQVGESHEGTGLGLPISKKLAELLGGDLTVRSVPSVGSTFRLVLPLEPRSHEAGEATRTGAPS